MTLAIQTAHLNKTVPNHTAVTDVSLEVDWVGTQSSIFRRTLGYCGVLYDRPFMLEIRMIETITPESVGMSSGHLKEISPAMQAFVDQGKIAGIATLIARRGKVGRRKQRPQFAPATCGFRDSEGGLRTDISRELHR